MSINTPSTPEVRKSPQQHFEGEIKPVTYEQGPDSLEIKLLEASIEDGDLVIIDGNQPENPKFGKLHGATPIAQLRVGGIPEKGLPKQLISVYKVTEDFSPALMDIIEFGFDRKDVKDGFLLSVSDENPGAYSYIKGFAFVSDHTFFGIIGRESNLPWVDGTGSKSEDRYWTPFNKSVSREQLNISYIDGNLMIKGKSKNSETKLITRATKEHQKVVDQNQAYKELAAKEEAERAEKARKARSIGRKVLDKVRNK